jgi:hypothetical protein
VTGRQSKVTVRVRLVISCPSFDLFFLPSCVKSLTAMGQKQKKSTKKFEKVEKAVLVCRCCSAIHFVCVPQQHLTRTLQERRIAAKRKRRGKQAVARAPAHCPVLLQILPLRLHQPLRRSQRLRSRLRRPSEPSKRLRQCVLNDSVVKLVLISRCCAARRARC